MRGVAAALRDRFSGIDVRSDAALLAGLVLAAAMVVAVVVAAIAAVIQIVD